MLQRYTTEERSVIQLSLPTAMLQRITHLAIERNTNRSALIREAIAATYFAPQAEVAHQDRPDVEHLNHQRDV